MRYGLKIFILTFITFIFGCSDRNSGIDITLPDDTHLEDTKAGAWIKAFNLTYEKTNYFHDITKKIHDKLHGIPEPEDLSIEETKKKWIPAFLRDKYSEDNNSETWIWVIYSVYSPFNFNERNKLIIYENFTGDVNPWIELKLEPEEIPWSILIPDHHEALKPNRKYIHAVTITSKADGGARLFLFGWGNYCTKISLF